VSRFEGQDIPVQEEAAMTKQQKQQTAQETRYEHDQKRYKVRWAKVQKFLQDEQGKKKT
jgi:hypothetical protein